MTGTPLIDRELEDLPPELRWQEWLRRVEAVLFASKDPVEVDALQRVVGQGVSVEILMSDLKAQLKDRPYDVARIGDGWQLRTKASYGEVIRVAANVEDELSGLKEFDVAVLAAIAYHQPITRDGLRDIFGKDIARELIGRLSSRDLIAAGPRSPRRGAPYTYVTTDLFLTAFGLESLADLPDREAMQDAGILG
ncbi:SMC-Scp complex subunit ScpB [Cognatishimia sp. D5M38]|uniref:SMC-Scp complex subunit ScpB n=1 Tax=Cognatishimia coralii TaxID=3083254 RepID=A0ABU8QLE3_9RHOB